MVSFTPGPNNILAMANASKFGFKKSLRFCLGVFTGFFVIMLISSYFNLLFFTLIPKVNVFMQLLGAGFMLYLAFKIMHTKGEEPQEVEDGLEESNHITAGFKNKKMNLFLTGFSLQFINPKGILYAITVVSNFIIPYYNSNIALFLFSFLLSFVGILSTASWALFGSIFNKFLSSYQKQFNIVMGLLLIYSALSISGLLDLFK